MSQQAKKGGVPVLRFPEFLEAGEWDKKNLGKTCKNLDNKRIPITEVNRNKGKIPYYGASGIVDYVNEFIFDVVCFFDKFVCMVRISF